MVKVQRGHDGEAEAPETNIGLNSETVILNKYITAELQSLLKGLWIFYTNLIITLNENNENNSQWYISLGLIIKKESRIAVKSLSSSELLIMTVMQLKSMKWKNSYINVKFNFSNRLKQLYKNLLWVFVLNAMMTHHMDCMRLIYKHSSSDARVCLFKMDEVCQTPAVLFLVPLRWWTDSEIS